MSRYALPIPRKDFYGWGGFSNPALYRKTNSCGSWLYYKAVDRDAYHGPNPHAIHS